MTTYEPRGAAHELLLERGPEVAIVGVAGSGKTVAALMKLHLTCLMVPGVQALIVRQTHASLVASTGKVYSGFVAAQEIASGSVRWYGGSASSPPGYRYANGSMIMLGGMDNPGKVLSQSLDRVLVDEADQISVTAYETLLTRLRGSAATYKQIMIACNPAAPTHWIKERADDPDTALRMLTSVHRDNPYLFTRNGEATAAGSDYLSFLGSLTGIRRERYLYGRWTAAEGLVFDDFRESDHVIDGTAVPPIQRTFNSVDWGYNNALVWQEWGVDADNRMYLMREISRKGWLVEDFARHCRDELWRTPEGTPSLPEAVVADHDAEDRATFERHARFPTLAARKAVGQGVQAVQQRLRKNGKGAPGLFVVRGGLMGRDPLAEARRTPRGFISEVTGYVWQTERGTDGIPKEAPMKVNDHSMDAARYAVMYLDGAPPAKAGNPARPGDARPPSGGQWSQRVG